MALDFTLPPELRDLLDRVRAYVEEEALPTEADVARELLKPAAQGESVRAACGDL